MKSQAIFLAFVGAFHSQNVSAFSSMKTSSARIIDTSASASASASASTSTSTSTSTSLHAETENSQSRRDILRKSASTFLSIATTVTASSTFFPSSALASAYPQEKTDKDNILKGYKRLEYLLENW